MQLSQQTIHIIKATAPVLAQHGLAIVSTMYRNMFRDNPEVKPYFNQANQTALADKTRASQLETFRDQMFPQGGRQQLSLAQAIISYASNIDNLAALTPAVLRIAHKHASLDIRQEHYPIVGKHLLGAIREVLGEAATDEIMQAWTEAFAVLASLFVKTEDGLRAENASKPGGWDGFRPFRVVKRKPESDEVCSFYFQPCDGGPVPAYRAGQYTCFRLEIPGAGRVYRNYSLSTAPGRAELRVSIKREPGAREFPDGVCSNYFHDHVHEGDVLDLAPPYGDFMLDESVLRTERPLVFIAAGAGITPVFSMFQRVIETKPTHPIYFIQCMRHGRLHPLKAEVAELARTGTTVVLHTVYSQPQPADQPGVDYQTAGKLSFETLQQILPSSDCEFYFTGPVPFMRHVRLALHRFGVPASQIRYECFGPHASDVEADLS